MRRYVRELGSVSIGTAAVTSYIVIKTDEVPHHEVIAAGFQEVDPQLSDDDAMKKYGVKKIDLVIDTRRPSGKVN